MSAKYAVTVYDRAGEFLTREAANIKVACAFALEFADRYRDKAICVTNYDRCDEEYDGLTSDEREQVDNAIAAGRAVSK